MADSTDPQLILWDVERLRTLANQLYNINTALTQYRTDYAAQGISAKATTAGANNIGDSYATVGYPAMTGTQIVNMAAAFTQLDTAFNVTAVPGVGSTVATLLAALHRAP